MSATSSQRFPACKRLHVLFLADVDRPAPRQDYLFLCHTEGIAVRWVDQGDGWKPIGAKPDGALVMQPMG